MSPLLRWLALTLLAPCFAAAAGFERDGWISDLQAIRDEMSRNYANLEWSVKERGLDLAATYADAERRIGAASDDAGARKAIERFIDAFADGHLEISWPEKPMAASGSPPDLCAQLGYFDVGDAGATATKLPGFEPLNTAAAPHIPAGFVNVGARRLGVLRLPIFTPQGFPDVCPTALKEAGLSAGSACDEACEERVAFIADAIVLREVEAQVRALVQGKPAAILVDIVRNGGGDDISIAIAQMLTDRPLHTPRMGFVRGPRWKKVLADKQATIRAGLASATGEERTLLKRLDAGLGKAVREAGKPCERSPLWRNAVIRCSQVVTEPLFAGGLVDTVIPLAFAGKPWADTVSVLSHYSFSPGLWRGPLLVLSDRNTASSSELFAAMLRDAGAATLIGQPTFGVGCGHATPRKPLTLKHSGGRLDMPDCVRLRANGELETGGIDPDIVVLFRGNDTAFQRSRRLQAALPAILATVASH